MFVRNRRFFAAEGGAGGGGEGAPPAEDTNAKMLKTMTDLASAVSNFGEQVGGLKSRLDSLEEARRAERDAAADAEKKKKTAPRDNFDPTLASREEFLDEIDRRVNARLEELGKKVDETQGKDALDEGKRLVEKAMKDHPDFKQWGPEIMDIIKVYPNLLPEDAYLMARSRNPAKAKEIDAKMAEEAQKKEEEQAKAAEAKQRAKDVEARKKAFGGLPPTSGKAQKTRTKSVNDAAESAWAQHMEGLDVGEANIV